MGRRGQGNSNLSLLKVSLDKKERVRGKEDTEQQDAEKKYRCQVLQTQNGA